MTRAPLGASGIFPYVIAAHALAVHPAAHAQKIPTIVVIVLGAVVISPLLAVPIKWATSRLLGARVRAGALWLAWVMDCLIWLVMLPVAWSMWDRHGLPVVLPGLAILATVAHHRLLRSRDDARGTAGAALAVWARSLALALEAPLLGLLLATLAWLAAFF